MRSTVVNIHSQWGTAGQRDEKCGNCVKRVVRTYRGRGIRTDWGLNGQTYLKRRNNLATDDWAFLFTYSWPSRASFQQKIIGNLKLHQILEQPHDIGWERCDWVFGLALQKTNIILFRRPNILLRPASIPNATDLEQKTIRRLSHDR